jgi:hypothetical protein
MQAGPDRPSTQSSSIKVARIISRQFNKDSHWYNTEFFIQSLSIHVLAKVLIEAVPTDSDAKYKNLDGRGGWVVTSGGYTRGCSSVMLVSVKGVVVSTLEALDIPKTAFKERADEVGEESNESKSL